MTLSDLEGAAIAESNGGVNEEETVEIREVWADNLDAEFVLIREIVDDFPFVSVDTVSPGFVYCPMEALPSITVTDYNYNSLKGNVDMLHLIQLGLTFSGPAGELPAVGAGGRPCVWQFNFREFDDTRDNHDKDSIMLLRHSGIDFRHNAKHGVDASKFADLLVSSSVVLNAEVHIVSFDARYDFGYLLKILTGKSLPDTQAGFFDLMRIYFPTFYDIKHLRKFCNLGKSYGLNELAELLVVERLGETHQAGSDSLVTSCVFLKLKDSFFHGVIDKYAGVLFGLKAH